MHAALYFAIFYMHAIFPLQKTFTFVMRSCVLFFKFFDLFSKTHARFPGFLSRIPLVYNAHQLSFETFNISINISPPDLTAAFISYVKKVNMLTRKNGRLRVQSSIYHRCHVQFLTTGYVNLLSARGL